MTEEARSFRDEVIQTPKDQLLSGGQESLVLAGDSAMTSNDPRTAMSNYRSALAGAPDDSGIWTKYVRAIMALQPANGNEGYQQRRNGAAASYNAYLTSRTASARAASLAELARALDKREMFRPSLQAYEASLAIESNSSLSAEYEDLKARKGFRVVEHTVDADNSNPRVCVQFSEDLVKSGVDYAQFLSVDNAAPNRSKPPAGRFASADWSTARTTG